MTNQTVKRKSDHLAICMEENVQARNVTSGFNDVFFVHRALPEIDRDDIDISSVAFNHNFLAPILIEAMTGGTPEATEINATLAQVVEQLGLGLGVGSQRVAIEDSRLEGSFTVARDKAPTAFLIANIGGPQIIRNGVKKAKRAVEMINSDALAVHLNPLQEAIQPEGETNYVGIFKKISEIVREIDVPVIVKETGAGIGAEEARMLNTINVAGLDVAGAGGTSWAAVEYYRAKNVGDKLRQRLGKTFWDWGIPTVVSVIEAVQSVPLTVIASGGVRSGMDVAKALALGADLTGMALPILGHATKGLKALDQFLKFMIQELRNTMFLVGARSIQELKEVPVVVTGKTAEWLRLRGFRPELFAKRKI